MKAFPPPAIMNNGHQYILSLFERCKSMRELKQLHGHMITTAQIRYVIPSSRLIDFCANSESGDLDYASSLFSRFDRPTIFMWNSIIRGLSHANDPDRALSMYRQMLQLGHSPDHFTFPFVLRACAMNHDRDYGKCVHCRIVKSGFESDLYASSCLIHMYVSSADLEAGKLVFDKMPHRNVVAWTTLIAGLVSNDQAGEALRVFKLMELAGVQPNEVTMVNVLAACAQMRDLETGRWAHSHLCRIGIDPIPSNPNQNCRPNVILATAILDMYARCGSLKVARELLDAMPQKNLVSWNTMISAYNQYGRASAALGLYMDMRAAETMPDKVTLLSLLGASAQLGVLALGQIIHAYIEKTNTHEDVAIGTSLLDMYAKTGDTHSALQVFNSLQRKDVMAWTSLIIGLAMHGHGEEALGFFGEMQTHGLVPDHITYIGVLCACSHSGLIDEGREHFKSMTSKHGILPSMEHYGCMVDLLSRAGHLEEAEAFVGSMPVEPNIAIWSALLSGCKIHGNINLAQRVGNRIVELNPQGSGIYVLLSNIYAKAGKWLGVKRARELMRHKRVQKVHGCSFIQLNTLSSSIH
ncbi:hypothetical protein AAC387_Pa03g4031 [Persea americana]